MNAMFGRNGSVYASTARFDGTARALTEDELRIAVPSIFATTAHESRSERFRPIPTIEIVRGLAQEGFSVVGAIQSSPRDVTKHDFTKHLLRIRKIDADKSYSVGDTVVEMLLKNANDGTACYDLLAGLFRTACLNSLVAQLGTIDSVKVRHSGDVLNKVIEGTYTVVTEARKALAAPEQWGQIRLDRDEAEALAMAAHTVRFPEEQAANARAIAPRALLAPRRGADVGTDLWTRFNVIQENALRGGLTGHVQNERGAWNARTTREVKGIDQRVGLNKALFVLADAMAQIKGAAPIAA
jgi:hypothetical protein